MGGGYEFPDGVPVKIDITLLGANLSAHGQDIASKNSNDSIICFICFNCIISIIVRCLNINTILCGFLMLF
jgi:hypothetical protein